MGYWGTGILENDNALDYLRDYFELYDEGKEHKDIKTELGQPSVANQTQSYEAWIYLAYCQWKCGFLEDDVLKKVEEIIKSGIDRQSWIDGEATEKDIKQREKKLSKFFEKIQTINKKPRKRKKRILKEYPNKYIVGDCFTFKVNDKYGGIIIYQISNFPTEHPEISAYYRIVTFNYLKDSKFENKDFMKPNSVNIESVSCYFMREFEKDDRFVWVTNENIIINGISNMFFTFNRTEYIVEMAKNIDIQT